ncbi:MAG: hypothetical protein AB1630_05220 [bacterium]
MKKVLCLLVLATIGYGADFPAPSQYGTIAAAISAAADGDTVLSGRWDIYRNWE